MPFSMPAEIRLLEVRRLIDACSNKDFQSWWPQYMQVASGLEPGAAWKSVTPYISEPCQVYHQGQWRRVIEQYADPTTGRLGFLFTGLGMPPAQPIRLDPYPHSYASALRAHTQFEAFCTRVCKLIGLASDCSPIFVWLSHLVDLASSGHPGLVAVRQQSVGGILWVVESHELPNWTVLNPPVMEATRIGLEYWEALFRSEMSPSTRQVPSDRVKKQEEWRLDALALAAGHPDWTLAQIAARVGVSPSTLSRYAPLRHLRESRKQGTRIRPGFRDRESGAIEAIDDRD